MSLSTPSALHRQVAAVRRRLFLQTLIRALAWGWFVALAVAVVWFLVEPLLFSTPPGWLRWTVLGAAVAAGTAASVAFAVLRKASPVQAALALDEQFRLKERVTTSLLAAARRGRQPGRRGPAGRRRPARPAAPRRRTLPGSRAVDRLAGARLGRRAAPLDHLLPSRFQQGPGRRRHAEGAHRGDAGRDRPRAAAAPEAERGPQERPAQVGTPQGDRGRHRQDGEQPARNEGPREKEGAARRVEEEGRPGPQERRPRQAGGSAQGPQRGCGPINAEERGRPEEEGRRREEAGRRGQEGRGRQGPAAKGERTSCKRTRRS